MLPPWLKLTLYIAGGAAAVWVLLKAWQALRSRRSSLRAVAAVDSDQSSGENSHVERTASPAAPASSPVETPLSILKSPPPPDSSLPVEALTILKAQSQKQESQPPEVAGNPPASVNVSANESQREWAPPSWADRPLLSRNQADSAALPRVLPEDVPVTRQDDLVFGALTPAMAEFLPDSQARFEESRKELQAAGFYQPHAAQNFAAIRYLLIMVGLVLAGLILIAIPVQYEWMAIIGLIVLPLLGWAIPRLYVRGLASERRSEIERGMPDLLDMLNMCVSQGLTIPDALRRILPDLRFPYPALAQELRIVNEQALVGTMPTALENFGQRVDIPEVHSFTSLLTQTEKMGTSISDALTSYSDSMREGLKQRAEEKGNRATFRLLFPTVLCLMPAVYLFLLGPAIVELSNFFSRGGRDSLDQGTEVIQRLNERRGIPGPFDR